MTQGALWADLSGPPWRGADLHGRRRRSRSVQVALGAVVLGVFAAGCTGGDPDPSPVPTVESPDPTPVPTTETIQAPVRPPEMDRSDEAGALAAAEYFLRLFEYAMQTGDLEEWDAVSAADCGFCASVHDDVTRVYGADGRFVGGDISAGSPAVLGYDAVLDGYGIELSFAISQGAEVNSAGETVTPKVAAEGHAVIDVTRAADQWVLVGLSLRGEDP